jgi:hypothetical protein
MPLAAWTIDGATPARLSAGSVGLEKDLEAWIARDPALVDRGLVVVAQQLHLGAAGRLDLLCVDQQGRLVVVEIKRATLIRDTIAQAIDYASVVSAWSSEEVRSLVTDDVKAQHPNHPGVAAVFESSADESTPDVEIVIVGCGVDSSVDRMLDFLSSRFSVPIRAVTFDVFTLADGQRVLVRDEREQEVEPISSSRAGYSLQTVIEKAGGADSPGGRRMQAIIDAASRNGLYPRAYKYSVMLTPPTMKTRYLGTVWRVNRQQIVMTYSADAFAEFFPVDAASVRGILGDERIDFMSDEQAVEWGTRLDRLFDMIGERGKGAAGTADSTAS